MYNTKKSQKSLIPPSKDRGRDMLVAVHFSAPLL